MACRTWPGNNPVRQLALRRLALAFYDKILRINASMSHCEQDETTNKRETHVLLRHNSYLKTIRREAITVFNSASLLYIQH